MSREWVEKAIQKIESDFNRSADTHLINLPLFGLQGIDVYLKDESTHPTGSLKHRLARSLFLYGICNGWIDRGTTIIEASSGSTAVSEAYFAQMLELPFIAVMPACTSPDKIAKIEFYGGRCHLVEDPAAIDAVSRELAREKSGHFIDQFTYAERATDWRGNNNIAESIFRQLRHETHSEPSWIVMSAGTGGTLATLGRFIRYNHHPAQVCAVDPEYSVFADYFEERNPKLTCSAGSRIEGIGRPRVEPSFCPDVIDRMIKVPDSASVACMQILEKLLNRRVGPSSGTNFYGVMTLAKEMRAQGKQGSIVSVICDGGERYQDSYYNPEWLRRNQIFPEQYQPQLMADLGR